MRRTSASLAVAWGTGSSAGDVPQARRLCHPVVAVALALLVTAQAGRVCRSAVADDTETGRYAGETPALPAAETTEPHASGPSFVIRAKAVHPMTIEQPGSIERALIVVRDGRIEAVGVDLPVPSDLPLIDLRDEVICPGFVSAGSGLAGSHAGPHAVSAAYFAIDAYDPYNDYVEWLARGTTTVHLSPGEHRLVSGVGAIVKLGGPPHERTLIAEADVAVTLGVFGPPPIVERPFYASSDVPIEPARPQRPDSRLGPYLGLREAVEAAELWMQDPDRHRFEQFDYHARTFAKAWHAELPLRIHVWRAEDIEGALALVRQRDGAYLVGLTEADRLAETLAAARVPAIVRVDASYRHPGGNIGPDPEALEPNLTTPGRLSPPIALAGAAGDPREDLRMAAILAVRGGMPPDAALAAITRVPAEILGIDERVGSLAPGADADLLVLTGEPLDINSFVRRAYVGGRVVFEAPCGDGPPASSVGPPRPTSPALVIRAGTVWIGDGTVVRDGSLLIEEGRIQAVGSRVPHPPLARIIDAGPEAFVTPGFIDAHGHLGLEGDQTAATPDLPLHRTLGTVEREFQRVARAGVTTVLLAPYRGTPRGARMAAIKTAGPSRAARVTREVCGLRFSLRGQDPLTGVAPLKQAIEAGKKYDEGWKKYEAELAKWKAGEHTDEKGKDEAERAQTGKPDPITGKWEYTLSGDPLPEAITGYFIARLTGTTVEARISDPTGSEEVSARGTLDGNELTLEVDVDTPVGKPVIRATLDREDHLVGYVTIANYSIQFEATRVDKGPVEFRIEYKRKRTKDGRPLPPKVDEALEPFRALLAGRIPAVVEVETAAQITAALKLFVEDYKLPLVLLGAEDAADATERLLAHQEAVGIVVPPSIDGGRGPAAGPSVRAGRPYHQIADLSRRGLRVALQSDSEDAARHLSLMGLYAVRQGLGGDAALRALTIDAARMYKLDDRIGSLAVGRDADVLIFRGHPFDAGSRLERVIVAGEEVTDELE